MDILADELPSEALLPDGRLIRRARSIITEDGLMVYSEEKPGDTPILQYRGRVLSRPVLPPMNSPRRRRVYRVATEDGEVVVNAVSGCLCVYPTLRHHTPDTLAEQVRAGLIGIGSES